MTDNAIVATNLSKRFRLKGESRDSVKELFVRGRSKGGNEFWALRDASFEVPRGSTFALVGHNGSGKSTALKTLAGIHRPTSGTVEVNGRVSALLELGAGFHGELTGRENIRLNGAILGLSRKQIDASMDRIVDFAGIGEFIDAPVKVYSSGMYVRLGFSIAVTLDPEILIVDEIIAVGDEEFQRKCFDHLHELRKRGTTIVLVSHSLGIVQDLCDGAVWLDHGRVRQVGEAREIVRSYLSDVNEKEVEGAQVGPEGSERRRLGSGEVRVTSVEYLDEAGKPVSVLLSNRGGTIRMHYEADQPVSDAVFGLAFVHESGVTVAGPNSRASVRDLQLQPGRGVIDYRLDPLPLMPGAYDVTTAVVSRGHTYDYAEGEFDLKVRGSGSDEPGLMQMYGTWTPRPAGVPVGQTQEDL